MQRAALGRITDTRPKVLFKATYKTLQVLEAVGRQVRTRQHLPRVMVMAEVEDSPIFPAFQVNCLTFSVVQGLETEGALKTRLQSLAPMPHLTLLRNPRMTAEGTGPCSRSPVLTNLRPTRRLMRLPIHPVILSRPVEATNLLTIGLPPNSGSAVALVDLVAALSTIGLRNRNRNHRTRERSRVDGREIGRTDSPGVLRDSLTLSDGSDSEPAPWPEEVNTWANNQTVG